MTNLTKDLIKKTFLSLLEQKPLTQISVKMIVEECGINRNSFYYHYHDLPALIEEMVQEEADRIITDYPTIESAETALMAVSDFASKNKKAILHIYNSVNRSIFEQNLWKVCDYIVDSYSETLMKERSIDDFDKDTGFFLPIFIFIFLKFNTESEERSKSSRTNIPIPLTQITLKWRPLSREARKNHC